MSAVVTFAALSWDPALRGIVVVAVAVAVLCGSVYLVAGTNTGFRLGLLISLTALLGWMVIMGVIWTIYGKGVSDQARKPNWEVVEVHSGDLAEAATPQARSLDNWTKLAPSDTQRGEAQASATESIAGEEPEKPFKEETDFVVTEAYDRGGERHGPLGLNFRPFNFLHKPHYAIIRVQAVKEVEVAPGDAPPQPEPDPDSEVVTVVMLRDLGNVRQRPFLFTFGCLILFVLLANALHRRDKLATRHQAEAPASA